MEGREGTADGGVVTDEVDSSSSCQAQLAAAAAVGREEKPSQGGGVVLPAPTPVQSAAVAPAALAMPVKKRGRSRMYAADGSVLFPLNPRPISASMPPGQYSAPAAIWTKRGRWRRSGFFTKQRPRIEIDSLGEMVYCAAGANFVPHVITVATDEDVTSKIISFSQQGPRAICILTAIGVISNVTLRRPDCSGLTLTYKGLFEILSLSGSFMPKKNEGTRSRSDGMSISLASPDGRVLGGGVAGLLVAASPVQIVVGSFLLSYQLEQKTKKTKLETSAAVQTIVIPTSTMEMEDTHSSRQGQNLPSVPEPNLTTSSSFKEKNWSAARHFSAPDAQNSTADIDISVPGG